MTRVSPSEGGAGREAPTTPVNAPPAKPVEGRLAVWIPKAATIGCLGLTYWLASRNEGLRGVHALVFPFFGSDVVSRSQASYLVSNLISPVLIWTIEANREGVFRWLSWHCEYITKLVEAHLLTKVIFVGQSLAGAAVQTSGIERIAPIYYLFSMAAWDSTSSSEAQNMPTEVAKAVLPATLLGYALPAALINLVPLTATGVSLSYVNVQTSVVYSFFSAPVTVPILTSLISKAIHYVDRKVGLKTQGSKSTPQATNPYKTRNRFEVLRSLRLAYAVSFAIQAAQHLYTIARRINQVPGSQRPLATAVRSLWTYPIFAEHRYSSLALYAGATLSFGLYTAWELRRRGMVSNSDATGAATGVLAGQVLFGPGATYAGLWWWREGVLARNATSGERTT